MWYRSRLSFKKRFAVVPCVVPQHRYNGIDTGILQIISIIARTTEKIQEELHFFFGNYVKKNKSISTEAVNYEGARDTLLVSLTAEHLEPEAAASLPC